MDTPSLDETGWSPGKWLDQVGEDIVAPIVGIPAAAVKLYETALQVPESVAYIAQELFKDPAVVGRATGEVLSDTLRQFTSHYQDEKGEYTAESVLMTPLRRPIPFLLDVVTVASLGSSGAFSMSSKLARLGGLEEGVIQAARQSGRMAKVLQAAKNVARARGLDVSYLNAAMKMERIGQYAQKVGAFPWEMAKKGWRAAESVGPIKWVEEAINQTPRAREVSRKIGTIMQSALLRQQKLLEPGIFTVIPKEKTPLLRKIMSARESLKRVDWTPEEYAHIEGWLEANKHTQTALEGGKYAYDSGMVSDEANLHAQVKHIVAEERKEWLGIDRDAAAITEKQPWLRKKLGMSAERMEAEIAKTPQGRQKLQLLHAPPTVDELEHARLVRDRAVTLSDSPLMKYAYLPHIPTAAIDPENLIHAALAPGMATKYQSSQFMKRLGAHVLVETDPVKLQYRAAAARASLLGIGESYKATLYEHGIVQAASEIRPGLDYVVAPTFFGKAIDHQMLANSLIARDGLRMGKAAEEIAAQVTKDYATASMEKVVWVPKDVANVLKTMMAPIGPFGKFWDSITDMWRDMVLNWSPRYYVYNLIGNGVLQVLYGISPFQMRGRQFRDVAVEAERGFMQAEQNIGDTIGSVSAAKGIRTIREIQHKAGSFTDGMIRSNIMDAELSKVMGERNWAQKTAGLVGEQELSRLTQELGSIEDAVKQAMYTARRESIELQGGVVSAGMISNDPAIAVAKANTEIRSVTNEIQKAKERIGRLEGLRDEVLSAPAVRGHPIPSPSVVGESIPMDSAALGKKTEAVVPLKGTPSLVESLNARISSVNDRLLTLREALDSAIGIRGQNWAEIVKNLQGTLAAREMAHKLSPFADAVEKSVRNMEMFAGAYGRTTPFTKRYLRRVIPFWTFMSTMYKLYFTMPLIRPKTTWLWHRFAQMATDSMNDEGRPSFLKDKVFLGFTYGGKAVFASVGNWNPFETIGWRERGGMKIPAILDPAQHPIIQVGVKMTGGYDTFENPAPLEPGTQFMDAMGRAYRWNGYGKRAEQTSPSTPIVDAIFESIPQTALINDFLAQYGIRIPGGGPKLYIGPDGNPLYPRHAAMAVGRAFGFPISAASKDESALRDRIQQYKIMRGYYKLALRTQNPEDRAQALKILVDILQHPDFKVVR